MCLIYICMRVCMCVSLKAICVSIYFSVYFYLHVCLNFHSFICEAERKIERMISYLLVDFEMYDAGSRAAGS